MKPPQPSSITPIAAPDGSITAPTVVGPQGWKAAPRAVHLARFMNVLSLASFTLWALWAAFQSTPGQRIFWKTFEISQGLGPPVKEEMDVLLLGFGAVCLAIAGLHGWLIRACERGISAGWEIQMWVSILGLILFPIGTLIHGYILSQWFNSDVKRWFKAD